MADARHPPRRPARASPTCRRGWARTSTRRSSVFENVDFFGRLFGQSAGPSASARIAELLDSTGLAPFPDRPAGKLSGGMKQKLGLCCALIHDPDLLILDEPTTGVDPLSRRQFWELIDRIRARRPGMSVLVATAYMEEAERFDWLVAMDAGRVLATGTPAELLARTGTASARGGLHRPAARGEAARPPASSVDPARARRATARRSIEAQRPDAAASATSPPSTTSASGSSAARSSASSAPTAAARPRR